MNQSARIKKLINDLGIKNVHALPAVEKITVSSKIGKIKDSKMIEQIKTDLSKITGQRPIATKAKKSIAGFKVRQGELVGLTVNLRGPRMTDFLVKLVSVVLPSIRDFRGLPMKSFDQHGNLNVGIKEYTVFPEIAYDNATTTQGLGISISVKARSRSESIDLMKSYGLLIQ